MFEKMKWIQLDWMGEDQAKLITNPRTIEMNSIQSKEAKREIKRWIGVDLVGLFLKEWVKGCPQPSQQANQPLINQQ